DGVARSRQAFLQNRLLAHVKFSDQSTACEFLTGVSRAGKLHALAVVFSDPDSPLEEIRKASRGRHLNCARPAMPQIVPDPEGCPRPRSWSRVRKPSGGQAAATSAARRAILPTLCSVDYQHQHVDMIARGAPSSSRSNDPWPSYLQIWRGC